MQGLLVFSGLIDRLNRYVGWFAATLVLASCLISAGNALLRYAFSISSNAWLEIQWQMFAGIFLLGAPYVLQLNEHVRVDMLYGMYSARGKLWLDVFGIILFLFPATLLIAWMGVGFFWSSFESGERSSNAGGLILWPVKMLMPLGFSLLFLQGLSELIKRIAGLTGHRAMDFSYEKPLQ
jgi:TRAP-type mannitol/chloroaromatic compound transport system permease small subunit